MTIVGLSDPRVSLNNSLELDIVMRETATPGIVVNPRDTTESALVSVTEEREGVIYATFLTKVYIRKTSDGRIGSRGTSEVEKALH